MIGASGITAQYPGVDRPALSNVSLQAAAGEVTAIVGPNGSGKSTFVRALLGQMPLSSGVITIGDRPMNALTALERARRVAIVVQREEPAFPMSVRAYVSLGRHPYRRAWAAPSPADHGHVERALVEADVTGLADRSTAHLSGGEWQRVRVARALAQNTPALVLDEPTTFLDIAHEMSCFELLSRLAASGRTVLVVSHQLNLVARFAHQVGLLSSGRLVAFGPPADVMRGDILEHVYEWPLVVSRDPAIGAPMLIPLRRNR